MEVPRLGEMFECIEDHTGPGFFTCIHVWLRGEKQNQSVLVVLEQKSDSGGRLLAILKHCFLKIRLLYYGRFGSSLYFRLTVRRIWFSLI